jgi:branched-chain amino acid transport system substrate-binding protein
LDAVLRAVLLAGGYVVRRFLAAVITCISVFILAMILTGCAEPVPPATDRGQIISIGLILPLDGDYAKYGQLCKNAIDLAVDAVNSGGGMLGMQVEAIAGNDGAGDMVAKSAAEQFVSVQHVSAIVGPYTNQFSLAAASVCQENHTPMISIRASERNVTEIGSCIFRACYLDTYQGEILGRFAARDLKAKKAVVVFNESDENSGELIENFKKEIKRGGGEVVAELPYKQTTSDFTDLGKKLAGIKPDVVFLPDYEDKAGLIMKEAASRGINTIYLGTDLWDTGKLYKIAGKACINSYLPRHFSPDDNSPEVKEFVKLYESDYGVKPGPSAALAYDAINLVFEAMRKANSADPREIRNALSGIKDYKGVTGNYTFDNNRNPQKGGVIVKIVEGGEKFEKRIAP